jgi:hypothetical protein
MQYYPKSQIKTNLYTNGGELVYAQNLSNYTGFYFKISTGHLYTGKTPNNEKNFQLIPVNGPNSSPFSKNLEPANPNLNQNPNQSITLINDGISYPDGTLYPLEFDTSRYLNPFISRVIPTTNPTHPTEQDKQNGYFTRYFCKKNNELKYIEINKDMFTKLNSKDSQAAWDLYTPVSIKWIIKGDINVVNATNSTNVNIAARNNNFNGFNQFFKSYSQYYVGTSYKPTNPTSTNLTSFPPNPSKDGGY